MAQSLCRPHRHTPPLCAHPAGSLPGSRCHGAIEGTGCPMCRHPLGHGQGLLGTPPHQPGSTLGGTLNPCRGPRGSHLLPHSSVGASVGLGLFPPALRLGTGMGMGWSRPCWGQGAWAGDSPAGGQQRLLRPEALKCNPPALAHLAGVWPRPIWRLRSREGVSDRGVGSSWV